MFLFTTAPNSIEPTPSPTFVDFSGAFQDVLVVSCIYVLPHFQVCQLMAIIKILILH
jgi:hypothetical protein